VVIDPGHGGPVDTGKAGPNGLIEHDLNLTERRASEALEQEQLAPKARAIRLALEQVSDFGLFAFGVGVGVLA